MGTYEKKSFRYFWGAWCWALLAAIFIPTSLWYDRTIWVLFFVVEMWGAFRKTGDDTLSEFAHWLASWRRPNVAWWKSWGILAPGVVVACTWHSGFVASLGYSAVGAMQYLRVGGVTLLAYGPNLILGVLTSTIVFLFLFYHLLKFSKTG